MQRRFLRVCALAAAMIAGCDKRAPAPTTSASTTTMPATTAAVTTRPAAVIQINGQAAIFPPARMRLEQDGQHLVAMLFSDDPKEALKNNYTGNSFYLRMELDIADTAELPQTQWRYQAASSAEREDTPYGIFLVGRKNQLQPFDVRATFRRDGEDVIAVLLAGQFQVIDANTDRGPAKVAAVAAELTAHLDKNK